MSVAHHRALVHRRVSELLDELQPVGPRIRLYLPNLQVGDIDIRYVVGELRIGVWIMNVGQADAGECDVIADVSLLGSGASQQLQAKCPALGLRQSYFLNLGTIQNVAEGQFVNVMVIADPPTASRPGGEVWESNETDNIGTDGIYLTPVPEGHIQNGGHIPDDPEPPPDLEPPFPPIRES